jgi:hypothetical protein
MVSSTACDVKRRFAATGRWEEYGCASERRLPAQTEGWVAKAAIPIPLVRIKFLREYIFFNFYLQINQ